MLYFFINYLGGPELAKTCDNKWEMLIIYLQHIVIDEGWLPNLF